MEGDGVPGISYKTRWRKALSRRLEGGGISGPQAGWGKVGQRRADMGNKWRLETPNGSDGLDFGNWRANKRGLPLTIAIAAQRPQEELGLRTGAVCISHHHLSDRQMVHKGQKSLVGPPVGAGCSDSVPAVQLPLGS